MINLTCRHGESITLGDNITVTVVRCAGGEVQLRVQVPNDMPVTHLISDLDREQAFEAWRRLDIDYECYVD